MKKALSVCLMTFVAGCSAKYNATEIQKNEVSLTKDKEIVIAVPENGFYSKQEYPNSGDSAANAIKSAFLRYSDNVRVVSECRDVNCLSLKFPVADGYFVVPKILHWEDRATEWSSIPDKIEVKITIYKSTRQERLSSVILSGESKLATWGGDHPQDLLPQPVGEYVSSLYK